ncbi:MAG: hypothetical protein ACRDOD_08215 [Streptosporangiaceae bacterium]
MQASPVASGLDEDLRAAGLDGLAGLPREPVFLDDLYPAALTSSLAVSPLVAEITRLTAAVVAALLTDPSAKAVVPAGGQICTLFAVDIAGFTRQERDDDIRLYLHEKLYEFLQKAFGESGIPWAGCCCEDRGDGALVVIPPDIPGKGIIDPFPERLRALVRRHNHVSSEAARLQLRVAAHIGPVEHDGYGFVGTDVNLLFRMLEARPLKRALAESGAELAMIVSDYVYGSLVRRYPSLVSGEAFQPTRFQVKHTRAKAWTYLPGGQR